MPSPSFEGQSDQRHQGTVASFDTQRRNGTVVRDNGQSHAFGAEALDGQLRLLRPGQRVHWLPDAHGGIVYLTLITLPLDSQQ